MPPRVKALVAVFSVAVSFGVANTSTLLACLDVQGYLATLLTYMILPFVLAGIIVLIGLARLRFASERTWSALLELTLPALLQMLFVAYEPQCLGRVSCRSRSSPITPHLKADLA